MKTDIEIAGEYESKFRFYFVALVFTLLAATVQSAPLPDMSCLIKITEVTSWALLLLSGLSSLSFLEFSSVVYKNRFIANNEAYSERARELSKEVLKEIEGKGSAKYLVAKWSFALGLLLVIVSRASYGFNAS